MQQVRGMARRRGSQETLIARGIATSRKASTRLPVLAEARRLVTGSPRAIRLGRIGAHARGKWLVLCALFLGSAVVYGAVIGGQTARAYDALTGGIGRLAIAAGFGVKKITVTGQLHATDAAITSALGAGPDTMMLGFDTDAAKTRLEAVPWIRHAQVMRLLPSTLQVMVEERSPFAVWQSKGQTYVVDAEGVVLAPAHRDAYTDLPLVVGEGAAKNAAALVAQLAAHDDLNKQILAAIRVGDRRWTLKLLSGAEVMLPDDNVPEALASLVKLDGERRVLERDIATVDLR
ncbi:MAG: cell division protein FtsQ/DivIB, partial [Burkholderiales bacterium]